MSCISLPFSLNFYIFFTFSNIALNPLLKHPYFFISSSILFPPISFFVMNPSASISFSYSFFLSLSLFHYLSIYLSYYFLCFYTTFNIALNLSNSSCLSQIFLYPSPSGVLNTSIFISWFRNYCNS